MSRRHEDRQGRKQPGGRGPDRGGGWRGRGPQQGPGTRRPRGTRRQRGVVVTPTIEKLPDDGMVRLNRYLAMAGVCSRRAADELIESGRVTVNGKTVKQLGLRI